MLKNNGSNPAFKAQRYYDIRAHDECKLCAPLHLRLSWIICFSDKYAKNMQIKRYNKKPKRGFSQSDLTKSNKKKKKICFIGCKRYDFKQINEKLEWENMWHISKYSSPFTFSKKEALNEKWLAQVQGRLAIADNWFWSQSASWLPAGSVKDYFILHFTFCQWAGGVMWPQVEYPDTYRH